MCGRAGLGRVLGDREPQGESRTVPAVVFVDRIHPALRASREAAEQPFRQRERSNADFRKPLSCFCLLLLNSPGGNH